ncbi:PD-(D/E)XK nuclease family protein, partial [Kaarinaea lacus]
MQQQSFFFDAPHQNQCTIPVYKNLLDATCDLILQQHAERLPDLSTITVLLNNNDAVNSFRLALLNKANTMGYQALLGPQITTLHAWLNEQIFIEPATASNHTRELLLVEALQTHQHIYGHGSPWMLAESLMDLFNELTQWQVQLPASVNDFIESLTIAYGSTDEVSSSLGREALLVHTLWYAMHQQLNELNMVDQFGAILLKLGQSLGQLNSNQQLYYCGINQPTPAENEWRKQLFERNQLQVVSYNPSSLATDAEAPEYVQCLDLIFNHQKNAFLNRTQECQQRFPVSPVASVIGIYAASDSEDEALAVDFQVRRWLIEGKTQIGIVTENRKLARRIRALLERANVLVDDSAGWPLSTTSAATVLERWLETVEDDFHYLPLLDCLKSPFFLGHGQDHLQLVYFLEQHIVFDENIASGLQRYLKHIEFRKHKLPEDMDTKAYDRLVNLINDIAHAADPLLPLLDGNEYDASQFIEALLESMERLNIVNAYNNDAAGLQLLSEIDQLKSAAKIAPLTLTWTTFRNWLGLTLERFNFKPQDQESSVKLLTLKNSEYYSFDAVVIAGAEQEFLPRTASQSPFFNDAVRASLGIPTQQDYRKLSYYLFRRLLVSTANENSVFITRRAKENDEDIIPSPWVAELQAFHSLAYGTDLNDNRLSAIISDARARIKLDEAAMPSPVGATPRAASPAALIPEKLSASAYQQLIDCPYQFFSARCLKLAPPDTIKEALEKSDYGERVHKCLEAFHGDVTELPGPFTETISPQNRHQAIELLNRISQKVFAKDIEDNFMHRGWLKRWLLVIPLYIDWQMEQQGTGTPRATEINIEHATLEHGINIRGRIDRIDESKEQFSVIDYKTGYIPPIDDVLSGEAIQLPFYLLLLLSQSDHELTQIISKADAR